MCKTLDKLFDIKRVIDNSEKPLTTEEISEITTIHVRSVQRYAMRLANEGLVRFVARGQNLGYLYMGVNFDE